MHPVHLGYINLMFRTVVEHGCAVYEWSIVPGPKSKFSGSSVMH